MQKQKSVKRRIFQSNTGMVLLTLILFFAFNLLVGKIYLESIETEFKDALTQVADQQALEQLVKAWTIQRNGFFILMLVDGIACVILLIVISQRFTKRLASHVMEPLDALAEGARRIRENDLSGEIVYEGDIEFEKVCQLFNQMQQHILEEQKKNQKYEKARTDMIAGISHDLRTPLTAVQGTIKGLLDGVVTDPKMQNRFLETAYRRTGDMDTLLNQLFYFSKIETGNMPLTLLPTDLAAFLRSYANADRIWMEYEETTLTFQMKPDKADRQPVMVAADREQFRRILDNLLENSRKYAGVSPLHLQISLQCTGEKAVICFQDNGHGVPEEKLPYIFDEFYRGDASRNQEKGNGLGLYIVKYLIQSMDGSVTAENRDGCLIRMELPLILEGIES